MNQKSPPNHRQELIDFMSAHIRDSLGARPLPESFPAYERLGALLERCGEKENLAWAIGRALYFGSVYLLLFVITPFVLWSPDQRLIFLSLWGAFYLVLAIIFARLTAPPVFRIARKMLDQALLDCEAKKILDELKAKYGGYGPYYIAWAGATLTAIASAFLLYFDLNSRQATWCFVEAPSLQCSVRGLSLPYAAGGLPKATASVGIPEILWCTVGLLWIYVLSAKTCYMARFYGIFPKHLQGESIYGLSPAQSNCIQQIQSIATKVLLFWFGIVLLFTPLAIFLFNELTYFILFVVPLTSFLSLAFGTFVFLRCEQRIREKVNDRRVDTLGILELDIAELFDNRDSLESRNWDQFGHLLSLHRELSTTARYRSTLVETFSLLAPFAGPAVALGSHLI